MKLNRKQGRKQNTKLVRKLDRIYDDQKRNRKLARKQSKNIEQIQGLKTASVMNVKRQKSGPILS